ncbi:glycosyltransferase [Polaribacter porphyrae]|uniref:Glycosyl transferase family 2 n=1 Tax=Polaribacter porphyrae TaxID=1137780 RepID=A0A2S7WMN3_9FLAO|nr:glycosyltransferase [Polaribacter porphyrae]PQJ78874.1 glycosyl transferase family 2 [Polaribacter porphyrae]
MIITVTFYAFVVFTAIQILYLLYFSSTLTNSKGKKDASNLPISVLIFAKNGSKDLENNLPYVLAQEYPKFEIVLINNYSTDNTLEVLENFKAKHQNITIIDVENTEAFWGSKKYALTLGIKASKYNNLLFTEVSSKPASKFWLTEISKTFNGNKTITLGYSKYETKSSFTNILARFHNLLQALQCFSFAKSGTPFMAFDANFGYQKDTFFKVKGFINHIKKKDGVHDLFLKDAAVKKNTSFTISRDSFVKNKAPKSFKSWYLKLLQKRALQKNYKAKHQFLLSFFELTKLFFYGLGSVLFFFYPWQIILPIVLSYFFINFLVVGIATKKFKEPYLIFLLPFLEISLLLIQISIFIANLISKPDH